MMWAEVLVNELIEGGVTYFVVSPGSRSTPLALAVARHPRARGTIAYDERGAAFHAVGYARATARAAALVCTSGTAAANYLPAIAEASQDALPLVALTADRPPELHGIGANQTMEQQHLYGGFVRYFANVPPEEDGLPVSVPRDAIVAALGRAYAPLPGPVHLNCMFREPFVLEAGIPARVAAAPSAWRAPLETACAEAAAERVIGAAAGAQRPMLLAGHLPTFEAQRAASELADALGWPVWADVRSGRFRTGNRIGDTCALRRTIDADPRSGRGARPDFVLHLGGNFVSKALLEFLTRDFAGTYVKIPGDVRAPDPSRRCAVSVSGDPAAVCGTLVARASELPVAGAVVDKARWAYADLRAALEHESAPDLPLTEPAIAYLLSKHAAPGWGLAIGNSMPIRFCDRYAIGGGLPGEVACNRGVSGIDGTIATAIGFGAGLGRPVVCVLGDLSFLHDINSLTQLACLERPLVLLVVNNHGGGIFCHLPIAEQQDVFERSFFTPHAYAFDGAARQFGLSYARVETNAEFVSGLRAAQVEAGHALVELHVDQRLNMEAYRRLEARP